MDNSENNKNSFWNRHFENINDFIELPSNNDSFISMISLFISNVFNDFLSCE